MKKYIGSLFLMFCLPMIIISCGNDGSSGGQRQFTKAVVKLSTSATTTVIGGVAATLVLPSGVTVSSSNPPSADPSVVVASGQPIDNNYPWYTLGVYTTATSTQPALLDINVFRASGFGSGEFVSVTCKINNGFYPSQSDFYLSSNPSPTAYDIINKAPISGVTVSLSVSLM